MKRWEDGSKAGGRWWNREIEHPLIDDDPPIDGEA
tara:strand:+ start:310 stop:414 length:105 start_codon:yes stop_codon:yes gene_type:complete